MPLFAPPPLDADDRRVLAQIDTARRELAAHIHPARRWTGGLRRTTQARAIQGSNTIEGYVVSEADAVAAVDDDEPMDADEKTWAEIIGYRRVLTFALTVASKPGFIVDVQTLRAMHYMLLEHDLTAAPGHLRAGAIYVQRRDGSTVYEGPPADQVPVLMEGLVASLADQDTHPLVRGALAHLNLVMIHPWRDGNGRLARALQTLVLAQDQVFEPVFSSIEEWLGTHTDDYYRVLAATGHGSWNPERDTSLWVKFVLRAHHLQSQDLRLRVDHAERLGRQVLGLMENRGLPERMFDPAFDAALGVPVRRPGYVKRSGVEERTASRDLRTLVDLGLLEARGRTRGRHYVAAGALREVAAGSRESARRPEDPYPDLLGLIAAEAARSPYP